MADNEGKLTVHISPDMQTVNSLWKCVAGLHWRLSAVLEPCAGVAGFTSVIARLECRGLATHMTVDVKSYVQTRSSVLSSVASSVETISSILSATDFHTDNFETTFKSANGARELTWKFVATCHCSTPPSRCPRRTFESEDGDSRDPPSNVVFVVGSEKKRLFAHKELLSFFSSVMRAMFNGNFKENNCEVVLADEDPEQFVAFLCFIYRCENEITTSSAESLARLADYYDVKFVAEKVEDWLVEHKSDCDTMLLCRIADTYNYQALMNVCRDLAKKSGKLRDLVFQEDQWNELSADMRNGLLMAYVKTTF